MCIIQPLNIILCSLKEKVKEVKKHFSHNLKTCDDIKKLQINTWSSIVSACEKKKYFNNWFSLITFLHLNDWASFRLVLNVLAVCKGAIYVSSKSSYLKSSYLISFFFLSIFNIILSKGTLSWKICS